MCDEEELLNIEPTVVRCERCGEDLPMEAGNRPWCWRHSPYAKSLMNDPRMPPGDYE